MEMKQRNYVPLNERRLIIGTIVGSIIGTKISDGLFNAIFRDFSTMEWFELIVSGLAYIIGLIIFVTLSLTIVFKILKLKF